MIRKRLTIKGVLPESIIARYRGYLERLTAFQTTISDKPGLLAKLKPAEEGVKAVLAQVDEARKGEEAEE